MRKIQNDVLKTAVFGSVNTFEENGILKMYRFTDKEFKYFEENENYIHRFKKGKASSGINIDFYTDATLMKISMNCYVASSQTPCFVDVYVDGIMKEHFGYNVKEAGTIEKEIEFSCGVKRVTVWLPCLFEAQITEFLLNGEMFKPAEKERKLLFFGDSITQGYTSEFPSLTYTNIVTRELNAESVNRGIGAALFDAEVPSDELPFTPEMVFVAYGTNDWAHSGERDFSANAKAYIERICKIYPNAEKYVILPVWRGLLEEKGKNAVMSFDEMHILLAQICKAYDVEVIDGMKLVPHRAEFFKADMTHPNEMGFLHYGNNLLKGISK